nr:glycerophosphodiester phosphodiesterase family protein [uncultured Haemophilus sp.]
MFKIILLMLFIPINAFSNVNLLTEKECPSWRSNIEQINSYKNNYTTSIKSLGDFNMDIPENSLQSFKLSYDKCRPAIEVPIRLTSDGVPIIFKDSKVGRMTQQNYNPEIDSGYNEEVKNLSIAQIKKLNLININNKITEYKIPTLEEFLNEFVNYDSNSIIFFNPEDDIDSILKTLQTLSSYISKHNNLNLEERLVVKINIGNIFSPSLWSIVLGEEGINRNIQFNPYLKWENIQSFNDTNYNIVKLMLE